MFGRELYNYTPAEGRNTSAYLIGIPGQNRLDPSGFANGNWGGPYGNLRDVFNFKNTVSSSTSLSEAQKKAAMGFARTIEAMELLYVIASRDSLGGIVQINADPQELAPFVSRDSMYKYILNTLDGAQTDLAAGGAAFPFTMHSGFAGFNTPANFIRFNRAIAARAAAYYATAGWRRGWARQRPALDASFINHGGDHGGAAQRGPFHLRGRPDTPNPFSQSNNTTAYAHMSIRPTRAQADGSFDNRYLAKIGSVPGQRAPGSGYPVDARLQPLPDDHVVHRNHP